MPTPRDGALRIVAERQRQIEEMGYTREHDLNQHTTRELLDAAWCYFRAGEAIVEGRIAFRGAFPYSWPFAREAWNPAATSVRNLEKAGALIAAAIDRQIADGFCPDREDATHCNHWWDDDGPCCSCGDDTPTELGGEPLAPLRVGDRVRSEPDEVFTADHPRGHVGEVVKVYEGGRWPYAVAFDGAEGTYNYSRHDLTLLPKGAPLGNTLGYKTADPDPDDLAEPFGLPEDDY